MRQEIANVSLPNLPIDWVDGGVARSDQNLIGAELGLGNVADLQHGLIAESGKIDSLHLHSPVLVHVVWLWNVVLAGGALRTTAHCVAAVFRSRNQSCSVSQSTGPTSPSSRRAR